MGAKAIQMSKRKNITNTLPFEILAEYGTVVETEEGNTYVELPFWMKLEGDQVVLCMEPPEDLSAFICKAGLGSHNPQPIKMEHD